MGRDVLAEEVVGQGVLKLDDSAALQGACATTCGKFGVLAPAQPRCWEHLPAALSGQPGNPSAGKT